MADEERGPLRPIEGVKQIICVASGKGGVGKTTVSVNLAVALAQMGYKVGLFDGDVHGPDVPLMLGVRRRKNTGTGEDDPNANPFWRGMGATVAVGYTEGIRQSEKGRPLERYGVKIMSIGLLVGEDQPVNAQAQLVGKMVLTMLRSIDWGELDYLLIDLPPGTGEPQQSLTSLLQIDGVVIVTTPPDVSLLDTTKCLNLFRQNHIKVLGLVENMSYFICPTCDTRHQIFHRSTHEDERAVRGADVPVLGQIPLTPPLSEAGDIGRPLLITDPTGPIAAAFLETAQTISVRMKDER